MKNLVVHTLVNLSNWHVDERFQQQYDNINSDRLSIVGIPDEGNKIISIGVAFAAYPQNFSRFLGTHYATLRAESFQGKYKPYSVMTFTEESFTMGNLLNVLYEIHNGLISLTTKEVKRLVNQQIVK